MSGMSGFGEVESTCALGEQWSIEICNFRKNWNGCSIITDPGHTVCSWLCSSVVSKGETLQKLRGGREKPLALQLQRYLLFAMHAPRGAHVMGFLLLQDTLGIRGLNLQLGTQSLPFTRSTWQIYVGVRGWDHTQRGSCRVLKEKSSSVILRRSHISWQ